MNQNNKKNRNGNKKSSMGRTLILPRQMYKAPKKKKIIKRDDKNAKKQITRRRRRNFDSKATRQLSSPMKERTKRIKYKHQQNQEKGTNSKKVKKTPTSQLQPKGQEQWRLQWRQRWKIRLVCNIFTLNDQLYSLSQNKRHILSRDLKYNLTVTIRRVFGFRIDIDNSKSPYENVIEIILQEPIKRVSVSKNECSLS